MVPTSPRKKPLLPAHDTMGSVQRLYDKMVEDGERLESEYLEEAQAKTRHFCFWKVMIAFMGVIILVFLAVLIAKFTGGGRRPSPTTPDTTRRGRRPSPAAPDANATTVNMTGVDTRELYSLDAGKELDAELPEGITDVLLSVPLGGAYEEERTTSVSYDEKTSKLQPRVRSTGYQTSAGQSRKPSTNKTFDDVY